MAKKIYELLGQELVAGDIGLEIEVENININVKDRRWKNDRDGSLRGDNREYILAKPLPAYEVRGALGVLKEQIAGANPVFSFRTSVHVHVNVQELTHTELINFFYLYLLMEEPLVNYCGDERKANRFCLRLSDAEGLLDILTQMAGMSGGKAYGLIPHNQYRYAAMNIEAIPKYGSLEFRAMRGTLDEEVINNWVLTLHHLRETAKQFENPKEIYNTARELGAKQLARKVLGPFWKTYLYPRIEQDLNHSLSITLDLPFAWKDVPEVAPKPAKKVEFQDMAFAPAEAVMRGHFVDGAERLYQRGPFAGRPRVIGRALVDSWPEGEAFDNRRQLDALDKPIEVGDRVECFRLMHVKDQAFIVEGMELALGKGGWVTHVDPAGVQVDWEGVDDGFKNPDEYFYPHKCLLKIGA